MSRIQILQKTGFWIEKILQNREILKDLVAPPAGLEPATTWLTVRCSTDWAKEEYWIVYSSKVRCSMRLRIFRHELRRNIELCILPKSGAQSALRIFRHELRRILQNKGNLFSFPRLCRLWAIFPDRRQSSIFATAALNFRVRNGNGWTHCVNITDSSGLLPWLFFCVSIELSSRAVASQVFSPLQRLTSVFGMGTGGPTALITLTTFGLFARLLCSLSFYERRKSQNP